MHNEEQILKCDDGSGRPARPEQTTLFNEVIQQLNTVDVVGLNLPPGWGKSYLARAWQLHYGATDILTPSNHLVDQYKRTYPQLNVVKGKTHYETYEDYDRAKRLAGQSKDSIFNPLSALFTRLRSPTKVKCVIVDEAHTLGEMLRSAASTSFNTSKSGIPSTCNNEYSLSVWIQDRFLKLQQKLREGKGTAAINLEFERVGAIYYSLRGLETKHVFKVTRQSVKTGHRVAQHLVIDAVLCPEGLLAQVLRADKVILMSGSLTQDETTLLAHGRSSTWISRPYLAPPVNRPVHIWTVDQESRRDVKILASKVRELYELHGRCPTLVHVTYSDSNAYRNELFDLDPLVNSTTNKFATEEEFRIRGGIWIASGCAEGIDLADDACRLLIIPSLLYANKGDIHVQKRLGLPDGQRWYCLKTLENTIQRLGRGVRHANDRCSSYILDPSFARLWSTYGSQFEKINIVWGQTR